jgi:neutral ceramidase
MSVNRTLFLATVVASSITSCGSKDNSNLSSDVKTGFELFNGYESTDSDYLIGAGVEDITGPMVGLETMGYAAPAKKTGGLHQRLWARSFVIADPNQTSKRLVYTTTDTCFVTLAVKAEVINRLKKKYGDQFTHTNVMITATHTHSGPGGYSTHGLYNQPTGGMSPENFEIIVAGIVKSIESANSKVQLGSIHFATDNIKGLSKNRSIAAYLKNPSAERNSYDQETDTESTLLRFDGADAPIGLLHWVAAHAVSVNKTNNLISGDNKGYAAWKFEKSFGTDYRTNKNFVAAFANSNAGDASPNIAGDVDGDGDWECRANENFACARESGEGHYRAALRMYESASRVVEKRLLASHRFIDFSDVAIPADQTGTGETASTCSSAIGLSMLAGSAEDGPGVGQEGTNCSSGVPLARLRCAQPKFKCHGEKPVVLPTGDMGPDGWTPNVLPTQIFVIGQVALVAVPSEMTTMSGRRLKNHLKESLESIGVERIVIAGYANAYSNYVTTREEYQTQNYEGASTLFGEWTLSAYKKVYKDLADSLVSDSEQPVKERVPAVVFPAKKAKMRLYRDREPIGSNFGDVIKQPSANYSRGQTVNVSFQASNLNNSLGKNQSLLEIQKQVGNNWVTELSEEHFDTKIQWEDQRLSRSFVNIHWNLSEDSSPGKYRVLYRGWALESDGKSKEFTGTSNAFEVR